jgi:hypothetical protein
MHSQFDVFSVSSPAPNPNPNSPEANATLSELLREILQVQKQILAQMQTTAAAQDAGARWRSLLARWKQVFPELPQGCRRALPILEQVYGTIIAGLVEELGQNGEESLDNDFTLQDFLDRYGIRLGQLGNIINLVGPLAEASSQSESS